MKKIIRATLWVVWIAMVGFITYAGMRALCENTHGLFRAIENIVDELLDIGEDMFPYAVLITPLVAVAKLLYKGLVRKESSKKVEG